MAPGARSERIAALDLVRGVAVLGILAINIAAFAGGTGAALSPNVLHPAAPADALTFAIGLVLFEGKMRGLFTLLFGASLLLLIDRREAAGQNGNYWQARRIAWLLAIGYAHQLFLWSGDILMLYALVAPFALALRHRSARQLTILALTGFLVWHAAFVIAGWSTVTAAEAVANGTADAATRASVEQSRELFAQDLQQEIAVLRLSYPAMLAGRFAETLYMPLLVAVFSFGETVPLMLLGMACYRSGLFTGGWSRHRLWQICLGGLAVGLPASAALTWWCWSRGFPVEAMYAMFLGAAGPPHLAMTLAYLAALMLAAPWLLRSEPGERLRAAGRMALSNYLLCSLVMAFCFFGWGLGLIGSVGSLRQWLFVLLGWALMLVWSKPWLARFRQGPAEWAWRSLTEGRRLPFVR